MMTASSFSNDRVNLQPLQDGIDANGVAIATHETEITDLQTAEVAAALIRADHETRITTLEAAGASAAPGQNLLINGSFQVNQRDFAGGALAAGVYGYDRWKAGALGALVSVVDGVVSLLTGSLIQVIKSPGLDGKTVTLSADVIGPEITGTIDGQSGPLPLAVVIGAGSVGNIEVEIDAGDGVDFADIKIEIGAAATDFQAQTDEAILLECLPYFWKTWVGGTMAEIAGPTAGAGTYASRANSSGSIMQKVAYPVPMISDPLKTVYSYVTGAAGMVRNVTTDVDMVMSVQGNDKSMLVWGTAASNNQISFHVECEAEL